MPEYEVRHCPHCFAFYFLCSSVKCLVLLQVAKTKLDVLAELTWCPRGEGIQFFLSIQTKTVAEKCSPYLFLAMNIKGPEQLDHNKLRMPEDIVKGER